MSITAHPFFEENIQLFEKFDEAHLFGSVLVDDCPNDIDLMLVYDSIPHNDLVCICDKIKQATFDHFNIPAHLLILSKNEKKQTQILEQINSVQLK